jgi:hypothetical protein
MSLQPEVIVAALSLLLSASLAVMYVRDRRHAKYTIESEHVRSLLGWHREVLGVLMRAKLLERPRESVEHKEDLARLAALIDQGRFYFPNIDKGDGFGRDKPAAYRGYRHVSLHFLGFAYELLHEPASPAAHADLNLLQRLFTSEIFAVVGPVERLARMKAMTDRYFATDQAVEDYMERVTGTDVSATMARLLRRGAITGKSFPDEAPGITAHQ